MPIQAGRNDLVLLLIVFVRDSRGSRGGEWTCEACEARKGGLTISCLRAKSFICLHPTLDFPSQVAQQPTLHLATAVLRQFLGLRLPGFIQGHPSLCNSSLWSC